MADIPSSGPSRDEIVDLIRENAREWNDLSARARDLAIRGMRYGGTGIAAGMVELRLSDVTTKLATVEAEKAKLFSALQQIDDRIDT
ncbi:hypothetical protein [Glaciibacter flavus]|uniref:hypothetical protein n=1 Tax=Orlajensenia flava TaxID=2565934 RepID=UPI003AFFEF30